MKKQTHLHTGWPEDEYIFIFGWTIPLNSTWIIYMIISFENVKILFVRQIRGRKNWKRMDGLDKAAVG